MAHRHRLLPCGEPYVNQTPTTSPVTPTEIPVFFHAGFGGPNPQSFVPKFRISISDPLLLEDVTIRFPKLKIVIAHMGWPFYDHARYMLFTYENCTSLQP